MLEELDPHISVNDVTEKAFQRGLFRVSKTFQGEKTVIRWLDIELPVVINGNSRRDSLDMIGIYMNGRKKGTFIICEVKFAHDNKHSDCPSKAAEELQRYIDCIGDGATLELNQIHHGVANFDWRKVPLKYEKWILANSAYWAYWLGHQEHKWSFQKGIYYCYVDIPGNAFKNKCNGLSTYIPEFPEEKAIIRTIWPNGDSKKASRQAQ